MGGRWGGVREGSGVYLVEEEAVHLDLCDPQSTNREVHNPTLTQTDIDISRTPVKPCLSGLQLQLLIRGAPHYSLFWRSPCSALYRLLPVPSTLLLTPANTVVGRMMSSCSEMMLLSTFRISCSQSVRLVFWNNFTRS